MVNAGDDVRVMIIDDHEVVRRGIAEVVERADGLGVVAEAGSVQEAIRRGELVRPDVALVDLRLPDGTENIKAVASGRILLDERTVSRRRADHSDPTADLTPSERRVLDLIGDGLSNREIGERLGVAEKTVKNHITSLLSKMGLQRRTQVAAWVAGQRAAGWRNGMN